MAPTSGDNDNGKQIMTMNLEIARSMTKKAITNDSDLIRDIDRQIKEKAEAGEVCVDVNIPLDKVRAVIAHYRSRDFGVVPVGVKFFWNKHRLFRIGWAW